MNNTVLIWSKDVEKTWKLLCLSLLHLYQSKMHIVLVNSFELPPVTSDKLIHTNDFLRKTAETEMSDLKQLVAHNFTHLPHLFSYETQLGKPIHVLNHLLTKYQTKSVLLDQDDYSKVSSLSNQYDLQKISLNNTSY